MNSVLHTIFSFLLLLVISNSLKAQGTALHPFEGTIHSYQWNGLKEGDLYEFYLTSDAEGSIRLDGMTGEFNFVNANVGLIGAGDSVASVQIQWNEGAAANNFFLWIEVNDISGCSNFRYVRIMPMSINRTISFNALISNECFDIAGNGFELPLTLLDSNGITLAQNLFPVHVEFAVNGVLYNQTLQTATSNLVIDDDMFVANPVEDTEISIEITAATDTESTEIVPEDENHLHVRTVFARPVIEFTQR